MITVGELKQMLEEYDDNRIVVISHDMEGNGYSPLEAISWGVYFSETAWNGDFVSADDLEEDDKVNIDEADQAIVLWPSN